MKKNINYTSLYKYYNKNQRLKNWFSCKCKEGKKKGKRIYLKKMMARVLEIQLKGNSKNLVIQAKELNLTPDFLFEKYFKRIAEQIL